MAATDSPKTPTTPGSPGAHAVPPLWNALIGITTLLVLLQGLWAGIFLEHDGKRDDATPWTTLHNIGGSVAVVVALVATFVAFRQLAHRRDLRNATAALAVLLIAEVGLGQASTSADWLTAVHVPLALFIMGLCVWLPVHARVG